jgi:hypothetical protein
MLFGFYYRFLVQFKDLSQALFDKDQTRMILSEGR